VRKRAAKCCSSCARGGPCENPNGSGVTLTDIVVGGLIATAALGVAGYFLLAPSPAPLAAPAQAAPSAVATGLNAGFTWAPSGNATAPAVGSPVVAVAQDASGNLYPVSGVVTAASPTAGVTFTPVQVGQAKLAPAAAASAGVSGLGLTIPVFPPASPPPAPINIAPLPLGATLVPSLSPQPLPAAGAPGNVATVAGAIVTAPSNPALASVAAPITLPVGYVASAVTSSLAGGYSWVATGSAAVPNVGDYVVAWVVSPSGKQWNYQGKVTSVSGGNVTFSRVSAQSRPSLSSGASSITLPAGFVYDATTGGGTVEAPVTA
jgi:hypothetical protein